MQRRNALTYRYCFCIRHPLISYDDHISPLFII